MFIPDNEPTSIDNWNKEQWRAEILAAKLRYLAVKQQFRENLPELLTLEQIRQEYGNSCNPLPSK